MFKMRNKHLSVQKLKSAIHNFRFFSHIGTTQVLTPFEYTLHANGFIAYANQLFNKRGKDRLRSIDIGAVNQAETLEKILAPLDLQPSNLEELMGTNLPNLLIFIKKFSKFCEVQLCAPTRDRASKNIPNLLALADKNGDTLLHIAAMEDNREAYEKFVELGSDLKLLNAQGQTPAQILASHGPDLEPDSELALLKPHSF